MAPLKNGLMEILKPPYPMTQVQQLAHTSQKKRKGTQGKRTVLYGGGGSIQRGILVPDDEHWNFGPVLTLIPDLFRNEIVR
jgi:hypothetical protein